MEVVVRSHQKPSDGSHCTCPLACRRLHTSPMPGGGHAVALPMSETCTCRIGDRGSSWELVGARGSSWELVGDRTDTAELGAPCWTLYRVPRLSSWSKKYRAFCMHLRSGCDQEVISRRSGGHREASWWDFRGIKPRQASLCHQAPSSVIKSAIKRAIKRHQVPSSVFIEVSSSAIKRHQAPSSTHCAMSGLCRWPSGA